MKIGFIGQGFIGKNYADDFESRGYTVVRYSLEEPYKANKEKIKECGIVFIAVPTPTTPQGFDDSIVRAVVADTAPGTIVVLKSTLLPGTTVSIQEQYPDRTILFSPEFLAEATASHNASNPDRNIIGVPVRDEAHEQAAKDVLAVLPEAPFNAVTSSTEAEIVKYAGNGFLYIKILFANILYDLAEKKNADWQTIRDCIAADPRIGGSHLRVVHASGHHGAKAGRGAGGHCFIKDFAALRAFYASLYPGDEAGIRMLTALECKNIDLLTASGKDADLLHGVYGEHPDICAS